MTDSAAANKTYFNQLASEYDSKYEKTLGKLEQRVRDNLDWIGVKQDGRLLDYACGTGLLSRAMATRIGQSVGIDVAEGMVESFNAKCQAEAIPPETRVAYVGNLLLPSDPSPATFSDPIFFNFDIAGVGAGFHHFEDPHLAARRLCERLRPGGTLFIVDFMPHQVEFGASRGVHHSGFSEETVRAIFDGAGAGGDFAFKELGEVVFHDARGEGSDMKRNIFLARGTKA